MIYYEADILWYIGYYWWFMIIFTLYFISLLYLIFFVYSFIDFIGMNAYAFNFVK